MGALAYADDILPFWLSLCVLCDNFYAYMISTARNSLPCLMLPSRPGCLLTKVSNSVLVYHNLSLEGTG